MSTVEPGSPTVRASESVSRAATPAIVRTTITHVRGAPLRNAFTYRSASWFVDLDHLPHLPAMLRPFARFRADDHFPEPATPDATLRDRLSAHLRSSGVTPTDGPVTALLSPRVAGYVFNPLSIFWCHHADGSLAHVVAEVHNTYGERHSYVVTTDDAGDAVVPKEFYVSPFNDVSGTYRLRVPEPAADGRVFASITLERTGQPPFVATLAGHTQPATIRNVLALQAAAPLAPLVVAARIRRQGIALWLKRLPVVNRPEHSQHATIAISEERS